MPESLQVGFIGLGRMGLPMAKLLEQQHEVVGYDIDLPIEPGFECVDNVQKLLEKQQGRKIVWLMVPAGEVAKLVAEFSSLLHKGDIVIDGGNSHWQASAEHAKTLEKTDIDLVCVGCSGGIEGAQKGPPMIVSGKPEAVRFIRPLLESLGGNYYYAEQNNQNRSTSHDANHGHGQAHLAKGLHNAIEYGMMQSLAEGVALYLSHGFSQQQIINILKVWSMRSIIESRLLTCLIECLENHDLTNSVSIQRSETLTTLQLLCNVEAALPVIHTALDARQQVEKNDPVVQTCLALMRKRFGGHAITSDG